MYVVSHQENHRVGITPQALYEFLVVNLCLGHIQSPIYGRCVAMFRGKCRGCISSWKEKKRYWSAVAYDWDSLPQL